MTKYPLGLPEGSVRAILAIVVIVSTLVYVLIYKQFIGELTTLAGLVLGYYFGSRQLKNTTTE